MVLFGIVVFKDQELFLRRIFLLRWQRTRNFAGQVTEDKNFAGQVARYKEFADEVAKDKKFCWW